MVGWQGPGDYSRQIAVEEIEHFAEKWLDRTDRYNDLVSTLLSINPSEPSIIVEQIMKKIIEQEANIDSHVEQRKWRLVLLDQLCGELSEEKDALQGLLKLTDFWAMFDFPDDSPHIVQGRGDERSPQAYYTQENFINMLAKHNQWLNREVEQLATLDK